jgi:hypothetical protein
VSDLIISGILVRVDQYGRYCLNDLHRASGEEQKHRPKYWGENQQTQDLINEIKKGGIPPIQSKQGLGTYVCKELVYAYAMWINAAFHLKVIRAYDAMVTNGQPFDPSSISRLQLIEMALQSEKDRIKTAEENRLLAEKVEVLEPKAEALDRLSSAEGSMCITTAAKIDWEAA